MPGELLHWACEHDLDDDEPLLFSRQRGSDARRKAIDRVRVWQTIKAAGWARLHTEYLTLSDTEAEQLMHGVPE